MFGLSKQLFESKSEIFLKLLHSSDLHSREWRLVAACRVRGNPSCPPPLRTTRDSFPIKWRAIFFRGDGIGSAVRLGSISVLQ